MPALDTVDQPAAAVEETKVFIQNPPVAPPTPVDAAEMPDNAEMEEGLSRLKLAIKALDDQFRKLRRSSHPRREPLAEAG